MPDFVDELRARMLRTKRWAEEREQAGVRIAVWDESCIGRDFHIKNNNPSTLNTNTIASSMMLFKDGTVHAGDLMNLYNDGWEEVGFAACFMS